MPDHAVLLDAPQAPGGSPKRQRVVEAAAALFLAHGYGAVSMDAVARRAGVSKATLYAHFTSKDALFGTLVRECAAASILDEALFPAEVADLRAALEALGQRVLRFLLDPRRLATYRMALAETERFPEIGRTLYADGPRRFRERMRDWLAALQAQGWLRDADPAVAAGQFGALLGGDLLLRARLMIPPPPGEAEIDRAIADAVETWLRAFAATPPAPRHGAAPAG